jgi:hypothetical protein
MRFRPQPPVTGHGKYNRRDRHRDYRTPGAAWFWLEGGKSTVGSRLNRLPGNVVWDNRRWSGGGFDFDASDEAVALAHHRLHVTRLLSRIRKNLSQPIDSPIQASLEIDMGPRPEALLKLFTGDQSSRPLQQGAEHLPRLLR